MLDLGSIWLVVPLIIVGLGSMLVLLMGTIPSLNGKGTLYRTVNLVLGFALFELYLRFHAPFSLAFGHSFQFDDEATLFKMAIIACVMAIIVYSRNTIENYSKQVAETYSLILLSCMGMMLLTSAMNLVTVFLGIELMSLPLYALVAINRDSKASTEAALKYFVMGALSSGLLLFGFAWLYGATGTFDLSVLASDVGAYNHIWLVVAFVFILSGLAFKFGVAPFHMWVPDVYEAAPTPVAALIASAPKIAMTALLLHLSQAFVNQYNEWGTMLVILSLISMLLGNILALSQDNIKRMLAYSSVGHMGIVFIAVACHSHLGFAASMMYIFIYAATNILAFSVLIQLKTKYQEVNAISDLSGLSKNYSLQAFAVLCAMFSMAGVPPMLGFMAKFIVLDAIIAQHNYIWAMVLILSSVIGAFYYIRVIKVMYFKESSFQSILLSTKASSVLTYANIAFVMVLGFMPALLWQVIQSVVN